MREDLVRYAEYMTQISLYPGWKPTPASRPRLRLESVLNPRAVKLPGTVDHFSAVKSVGMHLNDTWGDCTTAADANIIQGLTTYGQGREVRISDTYVLAAYEASGFDPKAGPPGNNPTDQGWTVADSLSYLRKTGMAGRKIALYGQIEPSDTKRVSQAVYEFGYLSIGLNLPKSAVAQFNAGPAKGSAHPVWSLTSDRSIDGGHCVCVAGYNSAGPLAWTWGSVVQMTWGFWRTYCEEVWAVVSSDWVSKVTGKDPDGVNVTVLGEEAKELLGTNPFAAV